MVREQFFTFACISTTGDTRTTQFSDTLTAKAPRGHHDGNAKFDFSRHPLLFLSKILTSLRRCGHCLSTRWSVLVGWVQLTARFFFFSGRWLLVSLKVLSSLHSISPPIESQLAPAAAAAAQGIEGGGGKKLHH